MPARHSTTASPVVGDPIVASGGTPGFALISVLLVLALLGVIGAEFAFSMRLEASMVRAYRDGVIAGHLAEAGVEQAIREIMSDHQLVGYPEDEPLTFFRSARQALPRLAREAVPLGPGRFSYRITDEESRINVNTTTEPILHRLLTELGLDKRVRDEIVDSIQDWKDTNEEHRLNGAESEDTYLKRPVPYRSRNGALEDISELLQIKGVTPEIYHGHDRTPGLKHVLTVRSGAAGQTSQVNINTASEVVLRALGLSAAEVSEIVQSRRIVPYTDTNRFAGRNFPITATSRTFRIEAEGQVGAEPEARLVAIVQKPTATRTATAEVVVLSWRPRQEPAPKKTAS